MKKYTHDDLHEAMTGSHNTIPLVMRSDDQPWLGQAIDCPYYVKLSGILGSDWGIIVNPESPHFCRVVFEHHQCGCPAGSHEVGNQRKDQWLARTSHKTTTG